MAAALGGLYFGTEKCATVLKLAERERDGKGEKRGIMSRERREINKRLKAKRRKTEKNIGYLQELSKAGKYEK